MRVHDVRNDKRMTTGGKADLAPLELLPPFRGDVDQVPQEVTLLPFVVVQLLRFDGQTECVQTFTVAE